MRQSEITMRVTLTIFAIWLAATTILAEESTKSVFGEEYERAAKVAFSMARLDSVSARCTLPLGMEEGKIPDDAITASSSYELKSVGPQNARIRQEKNGGAWCPKAQISSAIREYLEVDLTRNHLIAWTETQGRFGNGQGQEYAEAFFLEYWRDGSWHQYKNLKGEKVLRGNSNTYLVEKQKLDLPFVASRVRFVPYSLHPRTVCMRVEIYGCIWEQDIVRYSAPKGWKNGPSGCNVEDSSYDGTEVEERLTNGLGQLTDGILGLESEIAASKAATNWVGWNVEIVELVFEFVDVREFENCSIHVACLPELGIETFSELRIWFSLDGESYQPDADKFDTLGERVNRASPGGGSAGDTGDVRVDVRETETISVDLHSKIGRFVKLQLRPSSKWLLVSEVTFDTVPDTKNLSATDSSFERSPRTYRNQTESKIDLVNSETTPGSNRTIYQLNEDDSTPDAFPVGTSQTYIGLVSGLLTVLALFLTCTAFLMKQRGRNKIALLQKHTALLCGSPAPGVTINPKDVKMPNPVVVNGFSFNCKTISLPENPRPSLDRDDPTQSDHSSVYERTYKLFSDASLARDERNLSSCKTEYADLKYKLDLVKDKPMESAVSTTFSSNKVANYFHSGKINQKVHEGYYAATDILTIKRREQSSSSSVFSLFTPLHIREKDVRLSCNLESYNIQRISRHRLRILDKLGEGSFGLVHLCEAKGLESPELGSIKNRQIVIVRSLWRGVVDSLRIDFTKDMYVLATLRNPNVARIIALVEEEPFAAVFEYGQLGDLPTFLETRERSENEGTFVASDGYRLSFSRQIASGMKYLESANIPHCDLGARNCIVGQNFTVKVSDHAMYCSKYDHHYYVDGSYAKVPLRWMAWEAALLGKRTCRADVWSFAVTVWEIFTNCKEIPFSELTSEQVLENCSRWYQSDVTSSDGGSNNSASVSATINEKNPQARVLSRPSSCPVDLYRLMTKCWSKQVEDRPTFEEIYLYLKRLSLD